MLHPIFKLLPLVLVRYLAEQNCKRFTLRNGKTYVEPFKGVLFEVENKIYTNNDTFRPA
jgi:hypothetical protein